MTPPNIAVSTGAGLEEWLAAIDQRTAQVGIIGLGYVGLPLALLFSEERFRVTGFDIDAKKVASLNAGRSYIHRIEPDHIQAARRSGFRATAEFTEIASMDAVLICVPTPLNEDHTPDMSFVVSTIEAIAPHLRAGQLVVLESTTYPGTTEEIIVETINRVGGKKGLKVLRNPSASETEREIDGVMVAFSPEREDPGNIITPRRDIPKVIGGVDARATAAASALYGSVFRKTVPMSTPAAAEMTKLLENIYRCVNIALVNELKQLCGPMGIDIWEVIEAAATKPFGFQAFYPGPGVGGHCIPVDPFYLNWKARQFGIQAKFIELAGEVNEAMPEYVVQSTARALERNGTALSGAKVLVLGVAYKRDVDDLRESPSLVVIEKLRHAGAQVEYNDPFFPEVGRGRHYDLNMRSTPLEDLERFDCVLILTDHSLYNYGEIVSQARLVVDSRNATRSIDSPKIVRC
ncbi:nucleotide sugar dehydrogenase [Edaphobacter modestus]|uniref:UDP-N-acetyl-D-glucosamine dehydrogenase n=1 Tax=Edaphobacter modestus TaxID=388466 RepID=A0A4Q7YX66_9BACT|nr:nucleotide sugar dehydrogenase [Edaphobacter modestus]RZU41669.1 UDP-N-acetyl-D-glucosamine dehydrogenase [Edaphobacter modestus]